MSEKSKNNKFNLQNGMAFACQVGDFLENSVGNAVASRYLAAPVIEGEPKENTWYHVPVPDGISGDGSEYYIYIKKGTTDHLCIFFSGGGVAWDEYTAARPVTGGKLVAGLPNFYWNNLRPFTQLMNIHTGITDALNPMNPFKDWSFVIITYATGDFHVGRNDFSFKSEDGSEQVVHFRGHDNFRSAMNEARKLFPGPDKLLIAGDSAGAFAVPALAGEIIDRDYPECHDVTLLSDSGQLLYPHWKRTAKEIWRSGEPLWRALHTPNITMDWYHRLYAKHGDSIRYLYASSTHDYLLSAYYNDITYRKYRTNADVQEAFYEQMKVMVNDFRSMAPGSGIFLNDWKNLTIVYPGLRGGTVHTAVRHLNFYQKNQSGVSMAQWLSDAADGRVYNAGLELADQ